MRHISPAVGNWYRDLQSGNVFEVVAWDVNEQTIEAQLIDGELRDRKSTRLNSSHSQQSRMPSSA